MLSDPEQSETEQGPLHVLGEFGLPEKMTTMFKSQLQNFKKEPRGRRWDSEIINLCITLYCRSPKNYEFLYKSGFILLPSPQQIQRYKNKIDQKSGLNKDMLSW